ncbi:MAG: hypothetical protein FWE37_06990 [Spirochaetaceae bacterium]|nr:hypothetical protein [Spirochaetaceae bacterium]
MTTNKEHLLPLNTLDDTVKIIQALLSRELKVMTLSDKQPNLSKSTTHDKIFTPDDKRAPIFRLGEESDNTTKEHFWTLGLNDNLEICFIDLIATGNNLKVEVKPRMAFRGFNYYKADKAIFVHNHVNNLKPSFSEPDKKATVLLMRAGNLVDIEVIDHIVLNRNYEMASMLNLNMIDGLMGRAIFADLEVEQAAEVVSKLTEEVDYHKETISHQAEEIARLKEELAKK